jgi:hypothetical protein
MGALSDFERGQVVGACLAGAWHSYVYWERHFLRICPHSRIMGTELWRRGTVGEINIDRRSSCIMNGCSENSHNYCSTGDSRIEYTSRRPCFHKDCQRGLHRFNIHGKAAIVNLWLLKAVLMFKRWYSDHETLTSDNYKREPNMVKWVIIHTVPYIRKHLLSENIQGSIWSGISRSDKHGGCSVVVWTVVTW